MLHSLRIVDGRIAGALSLTTHARRGRCGASDAKAAPEASSVCYVSSTHICYRRQPTSNNHPRLVVSPDICATQSANRDDGGKSASLDGGGDAVLDSRSATASGLGWIGSFQVSLADRLGNHYVVVHNAMSESIQARTETPPPSVTGTLKGTQCYLKHTECAT